MNTLSRAVNPTRMAVRAVMAPTRRMITTQPPVPPKKEDLKEKKLPEKDPDHPDSIEKNPKHTGPGSKHALRNEDFGDEASFQKFGKEPVQDSNPAWPR